MTYLRKWQPELEAPSAQSAELFIPLSLLVAVVMVRNLGMSQLGISLLLAAAYHSLSFLSTRGPQRRLHALVTQSAATLAVPLLAYGLSGSVRAGLLAAIATILAQLLWLLVQPNTTGGLWRQFGAVLMFATAVSSLVSIEQPAIMMAATAAAVLVGTVIWMRQHRAEAYGLAGIAVVALPFIYGQLLGDMSAQAQSVLSLGALAVVLVAQLAAYSKARHVMNWQTVSTMVMGIAVAAVMLASALANSYVCLAVAVIVAAMLVVLAEQEKSYDWAESIAIVLTVPILKSFDSGPALVLSAVVSLAVLSALTLRYRSGILRWSSSLVWLLLPYALGQSHLVGVWSAPDYAWGYVIVMVLLLDLRAMALGLVFRSDKVRIISLMRSASLSYVFGYVTAGMGAVIVSLASGDSRLHTSLILMVIIAAAWIAGHLVERRSEVNALQPLLLQALLLSVLRPATGTGMMLTYLLTSTGIAAATYVIAVPSFDRVVTVTRPVALAALLSGLVTPLASLATDTVWPMALGLLVFGVMLLDYSRWRNQSDREWSLAIIALALAWFMNIIGVRELQAYVHLGVLLFGGLAYWRYQRAEQVQSDQYLWATLATATLPLALQAVSATDKGGLYGWWLLLEQITIMLIGMSIKRPIMTRWGLYVAVGAVLYQLRGLGYAALAVLAVFLIGLAMYRLQKADKK